MPLENPYDYNEIVKGFGSPEAYAAEIQRKRAAGMALQKPEEAYMFQKENPQYFPTQPSPTGPAYTPGGNPKASDYQVVHRTQEELWGPTGQWEGSNPTNPRYWDSSTNRWVSLARPTTYNDWMYQQTKDPAWLPTARRQAIPTANDLYQRWIAQGTAGMGTTPPLTSIDLTPPLTLTPGTSGWRPDLYHMNPAFFQNYNLSNIIQGQPPTQPPPQQPVSTQPAVGGGRPLPSPNTGYYPTLGIDTAAPGYVAQWAKSIVGYDPTPEQLRIAQFLVDNPGSGSGNLWLDLMGGPSSTGIAGSLRSDYNPQAFVQSQPGIQQLIDYTQGLQAKQTPPTAIQENINYFGGPQEYANIIMKKMAMGETLSEPEEAELFQSLYSSYFAPPEVVSSMGENLQYFGSPRAYLDAINAKLDAGQQLSEPEEAELFKQIYDKYFRLSNIFSHNPNR